MKKVIIFMGCACTTLVLALTNSRTSKSADLLLAKVEAITACESIGWWNNNGNCVNNGNGVYFCKTDTWHELTDCKI